MKQPVNCGICNDEGWKFYLIQRLTNQFGQQVVNAAGQAVDNLVPLVYGQNLDIPAKNLAMEPCACSAGQKMVAIKT